MAIWLPVRSHTLLESSLYPLGGYLTGRRGQLGQRLRLAFKDADRAGAGGLVCCGVMYIGFTGLIAVVLLRVPLGQAQPSPDLRDG
jgi:hypothetical protein